MSNPKPPVVTTKSGKLEGIYQDGLYIFKGIPYAAPTMGELRWMPPQPVKPWSGVRKADKFGTVAAQSRPTTGPLAAFVEAEPMSEDCLFLNIWTPSLDNAKRPVMFWIHGGAFVFGSGSSISYNSGALAKRGNIVQVTINYRLGELGFLRLKDVTGGKIPATGNEGLLDQIAALKWVRDNIAAFGGDPKNVTVFGESAGGMSIGCLLAMPAAKGLFHKAICESGVGSMSLSLTTANATAENFLKILGIKGSDAKALRALTMQQVLDTDAPLKTAMTRPGEAPRATVTAPVIDGELIPDITNKVARQGSAKEIPVIIGTNRDEWKLFGLMQPGIAQMDEAALKVRLATMIMPAYVPGLIEAYKKALVKRGVKTTPQEILSAIHTDGMFRMPAIELVEAQRDNGQRSFNYIFDWVSPVLGGMLGACHALEIGFVFGTYNDKFCGAGPEADKLSQCIQDAWLAFARTGNPSCECLGKWPEYGKKRLTMILGKNCHVEEAPYEDERKAWEGVKRFEAMP
ncbi:MAG: carboxylesterase/lipase family protein [Dehalococcoidales bacterium]